MDLHDTHGDLPQELVDAILAEVDDVALLKACSLVESRFRVPSQRILLDRITLSGMSESPHVATYITTLYLCLHIPNTNAPTVDTESLQWVLRHLVNVRRLTLCGFYGRRWLGQLPWTSLPPAQSEAVLDFVSQQNLDRLAVECISALSGEALVTFLTSARSVSFSRVTVQTGVRDSPRSLVAPIVKDLALDHGCDLFATLSHPYYRPYISTLRRVCFDNRYVRAIVEPHTLEHIHLLCNGESSISLSSLHSLRTIEFTISQRLAEARAPFLLDDISAILNSYTSHNLQNIVVNFPTKQAIPEGGMMPLDRALVAHPAAPRIRARLLAWDGPTPSTEFEEAMKMALPEAHALGRLVVVVVDYRSTREKPWFRFKAQPVAEPKAAVRFSIPNLN
ncbi:hypothetical protein C8R45DRAFT_368351 [Mycena sanguinolenta]|nr:hypothetical protein C8R45DRAFT_368351 [Mycena sanguinolenta]